LGVQEDEKASFLASLRALNDEKDRLEANIQATLGDSSTAKFQLAALTQERDHLKQLVEHQTQEIDQHLATLNSYEVQLSSLSTALSKMDHLLRQEQDEKRALHEDLSSAREMCAHLAKSKDTAVKELAAQQRENAKLQMQYDNISSEKEYLSGEVAKRESTVRGLESVISQERTKTFLSEKALGDQQAEYEHLKTQVRHMEENQTLLGQELRKSQSQQYMSTLRSLQSRADSTMTSSKERDTVSKANGSGHSAVSLSSTARSRDSLEDIVQREKDFMKKELDKLYKANNE
jgi:chromosome segregation ATPase